MWPRLWTTSCSADGAVAKSLHARSTRVTDLDARARSIRTMNVSGLKWPGTSARWSASSTSLPPSAAALLPPGCLSAAGIGLATSERPPRVIPSHHNPRSHATCAGISVAVLVFCVFFFVCVFFVFFCFCVCVCVFFYQLKKNTRTCFMPFAFATWAAPGFSPRFSGTAYHGGVS